MRVFEDNEIKRSIEEVNGECNGEKLGIRWIPDSEYLMKDALASSMDFAAFGSPPGSLFKKTNEHKIMKNV